MAMAKKILFWGSGSTPCWKPMIVLAEKNIPYESKLISFSEKGHKGPEVTKWNPRGQVPTFIDGDINVNESNAICFYLENTYTDIPLLPKDPVKLAKVLQRGFEALENMQSKMMLNVMYMMYNSETKDNVEKIKENKAKLREELNIWEKYLEDDKTDFIAGKEFTMADVFFFPYVAWTQRMSLNMEKFPKIKAYYERLLERPSIKSTMPPHWKDSPNMEHLKDC